MRTSSNPIIICPHASGKGGIVSVVQSWTTELEKRGTVVETHHSTTDTQGGTRLYELAQFARFLNRLRTGARPSLVHVNVGAGRSFVRKAAYLSVCHALDIPTIMHIHGVMLLVDYYERHTRQRRVFLRFLQRSSCVIMCSERHQDTLRRWANNSVTIHTLYNAPTPVHRPLKRNPISGRVTIAFLGLFVPEKGIWELLEAAETIHEQLDTAHFIFAGDGPEFAALSKEVSRRQMQDYVSLPGWVTGEDRLQILEQTDIFCLPSHSEGFPVSVVEAMSIGSAIVATDIGGIPEAVTDGEHGLLVPAKDPISLTNALLRLLHDRDLRAEFGAAAQKRAKEKFSQETIVDRLVTLWESTDAS